MGSMLGINAEAVNERYEEAKELVIKEQAVSVSMLQRRLRVGYYTAAAIIDLLESNKVVGPYDGTRPRKVLIKPEKTKEFRITQKEIFKLSSKNALLDRLKEEGFDLNKPVERGTDPSTCDVIFSQKEDSFEKEYGRLMESYESVSKELKEKVDTFDTADMTINVKSNVSVFEGIREKMETFQYADLNGKTLKMMYVEDSGVGLLSGIDKDGKVYVIGEVRRQ